VWDKKGHIVSNYHVVHQASTLTVTFPDGTQYDAKLVGIAPDYDLAVLKIDAPPDRLVPVEVAASRDLEVGQQVYAIGNPFGLDTTLSSGIVSALGRTITSMTDRKIHDVIQTDTAINPGNSGGPLLACCGRLIGVNTAILSPSGAYAGIGFAVPSDTVSRVVPQLIEKGRVTRAGLGVQLLPDHVTERAGLDGVAVYAVFDQTPAARAGLTGLGLNRFGELVFGDSSWRWTAGRRDDRGCAGDVGPAPAGRPRDAYGFTRGQVARDHPHADRGIRRPKEDLFIHSLRHHSTPR
jgi:S1-C subfamily serine protease